jgi:hypothetical protein
MHLIVLMKDFLICQKKKRERKRERKRGIIAHVDCA